MSTTRTVSVHCPTCAKEQFVLVAESANAMRHPRWHAQILDGTFMRFPCGACGGSFVVEQELLYTDLPNRVFIGVFPEAIRNEGGAHAASLAQGFAQTSGEARMTDIRCRAVFGYAELREKLVCFDAALDDLAVEALKLFLLTRNPDWAAGGSRGLVLDGVSSESLVFVHRGVEDAAGNPVGTVVARELYESVVANRATWIPFLKLLEGSPWVNLSRIAASAGASA